MMSVGILGTKLGMTKIFDSEGNSVPVTVVQAGPCPITQIKTPEKEAIAPFRSALEKLRKKISLVLI